MQILRERRPAQSVDGERFEPGAEFRPKEIRAWGDDPEQLYSKVEMRALVEQNVMKLPATYRLVLLLRDIEQLPIHEAASALGLSVAAFKARLLRGRLMLRDALTPHFASAVKEGAA